MICDQTGGIIVIGFQIQPNIILVGVNITLIIATGVNTVEITANGNQI